MKRILRTLCLFVLSITCLGLSAHAQVPGNCVSLAPTKPEGVPLHREARNSFSRQRIPGSETRTIPQASGGVAKNWACEPDFTNVDAQGSGVTDDHPLVVRT